MEERRVAGAEIVDRQPDAEAIQRLELGHRLLGVAHDAALGQLELEIRGVEGAALDHARDVAHQILLLELAPGQVDREAQAREARLVPGAHLRAGGAQHEAPELQDQAGLLGQRDELGGRDQAEVGVEPADQRLDADDRAIVQAHLRLVVDDQLGTLERAPQLGLQDQALERGGVHVGGIELVAAARVLLGAIERRVGVADQRLRCPRRRGDTM